MRRKIIAGNWKMNISPSESNTLITEIIQAVKDISTVDIILCPPYTALDAAGRALKGSALALGAQDMHWEEQGAFTGKISHDMLTDLGAGYVILGHSEQRSFFHETDENVNKKTKKALFTGLLPIICIGETLEERDAEKTEQVVEKQLRGALAEISAEDAARCIVAYEPVWAIGTGRNATPEQAQDVHAFLRKLLASMYSQNVADTIRIQYGGSMKPDNADGLLAKPDIDGGLIGGASLKAEAFAGIITAAAKVTQAG